MSRDVAWDTFLGDNVEHVCIPGMHVYAAASHVFMGVGTGFAACHGHTAMGNPPRKCLREGPNDNV